MAGRPFRFVLALLLGVSATALHAQQPLPGDLVVRIDAAIKDVMDKTGVPSASVGIAKDGLIVYKAAFGLAQVGESSIVANQPNARAGTIDIDASRKAARFVSWCDSFNVPLLTLVDTPGFEPGRDLEWRGMIRHGAQLVQAYAAATVPRVCVILRKAYGGAYIVMDSRGIANDLCLAWPGAEIAVMGTAGALEILGKKGLTADEYETAFLNPWRAAERGFVDAVIDPRDTRRALVDAFAMLQAKRVQAVSRKHANGPL